MSFINLLTLLQKPPGPYTGSVKARVVTAIRPVTYRSGGEERQSVTAGLADGSGAAKCVVYDPQQFPRFQAGNTVVIINFILRADHTIVVTRNSRSFLSAPIALPHEHADAAEMLVNPPQAPFMTLQQVLTSPAKTMVSVRGQIVQEDQEREVLVKNSPTRLKNIYLSDSLNVKVKVALWRDACDMPHRAGDFVTITDAVTNIHNNETSISLTSKSTIEATDAPLQERIVLVEGVGGNEETKELLTADGETLQVQTEILKTALPSGVSIESYIIENAPVTLTIFLRGATVERIQIQ